MIPGFFAAAAEGGGPAPGGDPYWANVVSLLHFDGDFQDETGKVWTGSGAHSFDDAPVPFGEELYLPRGSYVTTPSHPDFALSGDWTIEFFYTPSGESGVQEVLISARTSGAGGWEIRVDSGEWYAVVNAGGTAWGDPSTPPLANTGRRHVAVCRYSDGTASIFIDGDLYWHYADATALVYPGTPIYIGQSGWTSGRRPMAGNIDELRITNGVARYTSNFTPPTAPFPNGP